MGGIALSADPYGSIVALGPALAAATLSFIRSPNFLLTLATFWNSCLVNTVKYIYKKQKQKHNLAIGYQNINIKIISSKNLVVLLTHCVNFK